jgi:flap endonuclease-1
MGLQIGNIISKEDKEISDFKGKTLVVDAFNIIYQFLSTIRQPDGTPLQDSKGRITSHLSGLFYRNIALLNEGLRLVYVFDGKPPKLKAATHEKRQAAKDIARERYEAAKQGEDVEGMGKYAKQLTGLDAEKIKESKKLLEAMGIAVIQAPSEGEAQASFICKQGDVYAVASQDYDSLMFEAPKLLQNLTLAKKRKTAYGVKDVKPQIIETKKVLKELELNQDQLICLGILSGTDYNPAGVRGLGPKKSLKFVQEHKTPEAIFKAVEDHEKYELEFDWKSVFKEIKDPKIDKNYKIIYPEFDEQKIKEILIKYDFSEQRIENQLEKLRKVEDSKKQRTLF